MRELGRGRRRRGRLVALVLVLSSGGTETIGVASSLSGPFADYGTAGLDGVKLAVANINSSGGLLGKKVSVVSGDDQLDPATGETVTRNLILNDHVAALFGSVSSAVAAAQEQLAGQYKVPIFFHIANDVGLTTKTFNQYAFEFSPNTDMEPAAAALAFAKEYRPRAGPDRDDHAQLQLRARHRQRVPGRPEEGRGFLPGH